MDDKEKEEKLREEHRIHHEQFLLERLRKTAELARTLK